MQRGTAWSPDLHPSPSTLVPSPAKYGQSRVFKLSKFLSISLFLKAEKTSSMNQGKRVSLTQSITFFSGNFFEREIHGRCIRHFWREKDLQLAQQQFLRSFSPILSFALFFSCLTWSRRVIESRFLVSVWGTESGPAQEGRVWIGVLDTRSLSCVCSGTAPSVRNGSSSFEKKNHCHCSCPCGEKGFSSHPESIPLFVSSNSLISSVFRLTCSRRVPESNREEVAGLSFGERKVV